MSIFTASAAAKILGKVYQVLDSINCSELVCGEMTAWRCYERWTI